MSTEETFKVGETIYPNIGLIKQIFPTYSWLIDELNSGPFKIREIVNLSCCCHDTRSGHNLECSASLKESVGHCQLLIISNGGGGQVKKYSGAYFTKYSPLMLFFHRFICLFKKTATPKE